MANPEDPFLKICQKCKAACCKMGGSDLTEREARRIMKASNPIFFRRIDKNHYEMKSKGGVCPYLNKDHSCQIEDTKPLMCRSWPVDPDYKCKELVYEIIQCPLTRLLSPGQIKKMKKQAAKIQPHIINSSFSKSKLSKSDIDLIYARYQKFRRRSLK
jgi:Fe-S-cluster containining protein